MADPKNNSAISAWYDDTLSLIPNRALPLGSDDAATSRQAETLIQKQPGILSLSGDNVVLLALGNFEPCYTYHNRRDKKKLTTVGTLVECHEDGIAIMSSCGDNRQIIYLHRQALVVIVHKIVGDVDLPNSEIRLLEQILCGLSLRQAGEIDSVSYETKRSQFKSLCARTGFNTQSEVIRNFLISLVSHVVTSGNEKPKLARAENHESGQFLNIYYPGVFRFHEITQSNGRKLRVAETGPINGKPIVWLHSQTLPCPQQFRDQWTHNNGIRLLIPLREGFLEERDSAFSLPSHIENCTNDIVATIRYFCNGRASVVANSSAAPYAISLAVKYPQHVEHITFCATSYVGRYTSKPVRRLVNGVKNLVTKNEILIAKMFERYLKKMSSLPGILEVLKASYKDSEWDMAVFNKLLSNPVNHSWMYESYRKSRHSVIMDVAMGGRNVWKEASKIKCEVLFIHGAHDPINLPSDTREIAKQIAGSKVVVFEQAGQSLFLTLLADVVCLACDDNEVHQLEAGTKHPN